MLQAGKWGQQRHRVSSGFLNGMPVKKFGWGVMNIKYS
jgi:hypothetical protein